MTEQQEMEMRTRKKWRQVDKRGWWRVRHEGREDVKEGGDGQAPPTGGFKTQAFMSVAPASVGRKVYVWHRERQEGGRVQPAGTCWRTHSSAHSCSCSDVFRLHWVHTVVMWFIPSVPSISVSRRGWLSSSPNRKSRLSDEPNVTNVTTPCFIARPGWLAAISWCKCHVLQGL